MVFFLIAVVLVFAVIRVTIDSQNIATGVIPEEGEFDRRYAQYRSWPTPTSSPASSILSSPRSRSPAGSAIVISPCTERWGGSSCRSGSFPVSSASSSDSSSRSEAGRQRRRRVRDVVRHRSALAYSYIEPGIRSVIVGG